MNALSLNIRGLADPHKFDWIKRLLKDHRFSFGGLQESRISAMPSYLVDWWEVNNFDFDYVDSVGNSGGIVSFWDRSLYNVSTSIKSRYYLVTVGHWNGLAGETIFANIYAPQDPVEKKNLWDSIINLMRSRSGNWIVFGDFNAVRRLDERLNSHFCPRIASDFNAFIANSGLVEPSMGGRRFTYFSDIGCKLSKLDRFLVCVNFMSNFPTTSVTAYPRELSDHSPILLRTSYLDFGPTPFRFFISWIHRDGFDEIVVNAWNSFVGAGAADRVLADKLRHVKEAIKNWRRCEFDKENKELLDLRAKIDNIELLAEHRCLSESELADRRNCKHRVLELENLAKLDLIQKTKSKCIRDGDENSRFFHNSLKIKNKRCTFQGLMINGDWVTDTSKIKDETWNFFRDKFQETTRARPAFINPNFKRFSDSDRSFLEFPFGLNEIKQAIWDCSSEKAPGPDGFSFKFIKHYWLLMQDDIMKCVKHFEEFGCLSRGSNSSFISLLGIGSIASLKLSLLVKWVWRFKHNPEAMWCKVIGGIHNCQRKNLKSLGKKSIGGPWYNISRVFDVLQEIGISISDLFEFCIKCGENTLFWTEDWTGEGTFGDRFPSIYSLDKRKSCFVSERIGPDGVPKWSWKKIPRSALEMSELQNLIGAIPVSQLNMGRDDLKCKLSADGCFYVHDLRSFIDSKLTTPISNPTIWSHVIPLKINCFVWRACMDRIPTASALSRRGVRTSSLACLFCINGVEETNHIIADCPFATETLSRIMN